CQITDLNSSNGTYVDGEKLIPNIASALIPGSTIKIGAYTIQIKESALQDVKATEPAPPAEKPALEEPVASGAEPVKYAVQINKDAPAQQRKSGKGNLPPNPPSSSGTTEQPDFIPPGLSLHSQRLIQYLPGIYHTSFMARFLGLFESILTPIEWNVDNFDLFLNPGTAPAHFIPWLAHWFDLSFESTWTESQRRALLKDAHMIYARRGTRWSLSRVIEILTGYKPTIVDVADDLPDYTFKVILPLAASQTNREMIERLIDANKPAQTMYTLEFMP
ncbi:MAG: phage tail protein I, partial [Anaerolineae bacterium]|nr:phage tail protein I [Anaerolineae bacterium]